MKSQGHGQELPLAKGSLSLEDFKDNLIQYQREGDRDRHRREEEGPLGSVSP